MASVARILASLFAQERLTVLKESISGSRLAPLVNRG